MFFYIFVFVFCVLAFIFSLATKEEKIKRIIAIVSLMLLCIISGSRYNLGGTDYFVYKAIYEKIPISNFWTQISNLSTVHGIEKGYLIYSFFIKRLGVNFYGFTLIHSIIFYVLFYMILKKYDYNINFIIILFLYKMFFYNTFISLRQPLAILTFWFSIDFLKDKKLFGFQLIS